ncbi:transporter substrate-binding domain-containing protein [Agrococcus sp. DT81.2]|uniref:transporter substrate-binding domain-containing protein n=1 Tax=Agrococcus sp. DT81.2 TaxID=3393414 RepID=UPI003CE4D49C
MMRIVRALGVGAVATLVMTGCGIQVPADPEGTLERVEGGVMRVGVTENAPWVELGANDEPSGTEPALITEFAARHGATIAWTAGSEAELLDALDHGELDLVLGGFLEDTPWTEMGAATRPYVEAGTPDGNEKHVMLVRMGENAFLVALESFLDEEVGA